MTTDPSPSKDRDPSADGSDDLPVRMDLVRFLVVRGNFEHILIVRDGTQWDLPSFEYSRANSIRDGRCIDKLCSDVRDWFHIDSAVHFIAVVELFGDVVMWDESLSCVEEEDDPERNASLYVMQPQGICTEDLVLPSRAEWKEVSFFSRTAEESGSSNMRRVAKACASYMSSRGAMKDPRFQIGWYATASEFLRSVALEDVAIPDGDVKQVQVTFSSTVIKMNSSKSWYFAKAPSLGNSEFTITAKIAEIFPESSPIVLATNARLRCFVTREFEDVKPEKGNVHAVVQTLADMQLESLSHIEELEEAGCPIRDPDALKEQLKVWDDCKFAKHIYQGERFFEVLAAAVMPLCDKLQGFNIPNSLVHGDFALSNVAYAKGGREELILFDWQYACIGHPFFDFYRLYEGLDAESRDEVVEGYLRRWNQFGDMTRLREAFKFARCVGNLLHLWGPSESHDSCEHQVFSESEACCEYLVNRSLDVLLTEELAEWPSNWRFPQNAG